MSALDELGIAVQIRARPNEVDPAIPFADDHTHASYDPHAVHLFWRQLVSADRSGAVPRSVDFRDCSTCNYVTARAHRASIARDGVYRLL